MKEILMIGLSPIGGGKEKEALRVLQKNAKGVADAVEKFEDMAVALFSECDVKKAQKLGKEISELETKADDGRRKFAQDLSEGAFLPTFRGDLARLAERIDEVADVVEGAARGILLREKTIDVLLKAEKREKKVKVIRDGMIRMANVSTEVVKALVDSIGTLSSNIDAAASEVKRVNELEHEVDMLEQSILAAVFEYEKLLDPMTVVELNYLIRGIGDISDRAEDAGDVLSIIVYMFRT